MFKDMLHDIGKPRNKSTQNPGLFPTRIILYYTGCGRNNSHILKVNKNQTKQGTQKNYFIYKKHI